MSAAVDVATVVDNPAVRLFVERARAVRADFRLDASNAASIVAICVHLDGLPLALELAAAQVKHLSPEAILERVESRPDSLSSRRDDLPVRQRTLRATVAWSYDLLPQDERRLFRRLAAFAGGARLGEIESMALLKPEVPDPVAALETLVDRSLVRVRRTHGSEDRYVLLETMRSHGRELLREHGEDGLTSARHAAIYADLARRAEPEYYGLERRAWLDRIADEHDNIRAALEELAAAGDLTAALGLAADLWRFWQARGHLTEGRERLDALLEAAAAPGAPPVTDIAMSRAEEAAGGIRYWTQPDRVAPRPYYERSLEHALASGDRQREAWARYNLAFVFDFVPEARGLGQPDTARANELRTQALQMFRELGDRRGIAESLWAMGGNSLVMLQDPARARRTLEEALPALEEIGDLYGMGWAQTSMAMLDAMEGHIDKAEEGVLQAADLFRRHGETAGEIVTVQALGSLAGMRGDPATAVRLGAAADKAAAEIGGTLPRIPPIVDPIDAAAASLAPDDLRRERGIGIALGARAILDTALEAWRARAAAVEPGVLPRP